MKIFRILPGLTFFLLLATAGAQNLAPIPALAAHVTDAAGMLDASQRETLENTLSEYETRTGSQIGILLIKTTAPEVIEQYGIRVADAWKLGRKGVDDGAILIVAKDNPKDLRRLRIEAGRGVQGTLTDAQSKRILQDVIAPHFRQNDYYGGLTAAVAAMTVLLDQEHFAKPAGAAIGRQSGTQAQTDGFFDNLLPVLFFIFVIGAGLVSRIFGAGRFGRGSGLSSNDWGRTAGVILGSAIGASLGGSNRGGGFSDGGGGFSGGGGGFDGGGASGDW